MLQTLLGQKKRRKFQRNNFDQQKLFVYQVYKMAALKKLKMFKENVGKRDSIMSIF